MYETYRKVESVEQLRSTILSVTMSKAPQYEYLTQMLTANQYAVLRSIAREGLAEEPTGKEFLKKHKLPSASSVKTALGTLSDKELVYRLPGGYIVYDRFLGIWLSRL
jgi:DNA-binding MarR family transcriptional regulator